MNNKRFNRDIIRSKEESEKIIKDVNDKIAEKIQEAKEVEETKEIEEEPVPKPAPEELIPDDKPEVKHGTVIAELLNVRSAPEVGDNIIGKLKRHTSVDIITKGGTDNTWFFVKGEMTTGVSVSGYVMSKYIEEDK